MVAALTRVFGAHHLALAEDVVQDVFCRALTIWKVRGIPDNPSAWLMAAAKNRAIDVVRRERTARRFAPELERLLATEWTLAPALDEAFDPQVVRDAELRMMFSCCHPRLPEEAQLALMLNVSCGFGVDEAAGALLATPSAIEKRLSRGKKLLAQSRDLFELTSADFAARLSTVQRALYLLFNEGYHGASDVAAVRTELCQEALRLTAMLSQHEPSATPATSALLALLCLHAARLPARLDAAGELSALVDQDRSHYDARLIDEGLRWLERSAAGLELTAYHVEAAIAAEHVRAPALEHTNWSLIVDLYDRLLRLNPSPMVALARAIALAERDGPDAGLAALAALGEPERLARTPFLAAASAELERRRGRLEAARRHFEAARALARNAAESAILAKRIRCCAR
jgi:RNA polymerase sigma-70 factor (ECF subfamily)